MSFSQGRGLRQMSVAPKISPEASASCVKTQPEFRGLARMAETMARAFSQWTFWDARMNLSGEPKISDRRVFLNSLLSDS